MIWQGVDEIIMFDELENLMDQLLTSLTEQQEIPKYRKENPITGMDISKRFFKNEILDIFQKNFPQLFSKTAFGLVGEGSECFGFDDEISKDHDFGKRCCIWLADDVDRDMKNKIEKFFESIDGKIQVYYISEFYKYYTLFPEGPQSLEEYRKVPSDFLAVATNGEVFLDNFGKFTQVRERLLKYYPDDIVYKRMAYCLNQLAQSGQYNYIRCFNRNDLIGCEQSLSEFIKYYVHFIHIINRKYMPFYKWYKKSLETLPILGKETSKKLEELVTLNLKERIEYIENLCVEIKNYLKENNLSFEETSFLAYHSKNIVSHIKDEKLKNEDTWIN